MIVCDTNQIAYLLIGGESTEPARQVFLDPDWAAPIIWRSEFRSILTQYMRRGELKRSQAARLQEKAEEMMEGREYIGRSNQIFRIITDSNLSAYDYEFVALAKELHIPLVTSDQMILRKFAAIAMSPDEFIQRF